MRLVPLALRRDRLDVLASLAAEPSAFPLEAPDPVEHVTLLGRALPARLTILSDGRVERDGRPEGDDTLAAVERFVAEGPPFPYGGAVGYLAYEFGCFTEPGRGGSAPASDVPLAVLSRYDPVLRRAGRDALDPRARARAATAACPTPPSPRSGRQTRRRGPST